MVTAGVYLIARSYVLFTLAPVVLTIVAVIGAVTLLMAGFSALVQSDIKRTLAYSTISQIGYMFLALGVGAWTGAIFHFMTHAFFKALLFLGAGAVILGLHHEQNMFKMGGLRHHLPLTFWSFLMGAASLAAVPLITAGFYSKDFILYEAFISEPGGLWLWLAGLVGALITSIYAFRMVFLTFFGEAKTPVDKRPGLPIKLPLIILAVLSIIGGFVELPITLGGLHLFSNFMETVFPAAETEAPALQIELLLQGASAVVSLLGIYIAYLLYQQRPGLAESAANSALGRPLHRLWAMGWGFDWLYDRIFVRPYLWLAQANKADWIDLLPTGIARLNQALYHDLSRTQTGRVRLYALVIALGAALSIGLVILL
jgi:NADH-quinone oxidoreductase subunit L